MLIPQLNFTSQFCMAVFRSEIFIDQASQKNQNKRPTQVNSDANKRVRAQDLLELGVNQRLETTRSSNVPRFREKNE